MSELLTYQFDYEKRVLCFALCDLKAIDTIAKVLEPSDFLDQENNEIAKVVFELYEQSIEVSLITVVKSLPLTSRHNVMEIAYNIIPSGDLLYYCRQVKEASLKNQLSLLSYELTINPGKSSIETIEKVQDTINKITAKQIEVLKSTADIYDSIINRIGNEPIIGHSTGFKELDKQTNGILAPDLTIIAAGPGEGKSIFSLNIAEKVSSVGKVLFFSLEMKKEQIIERMISKATGFSVKEIRTSKYFNAIDQKEYDIDKGHVMQKAHYIKSLNIEFIDKGIVSVNTIVNKVRSMENKPALVVIDYLQLIPTSDSKGKTRDQLIGEITRALKLMCMEYDIPVILLSQVGRDKNRKRYQLSDLRESGNIEQDADNVWFIFRPSKHNINKHTFEGYEVMVEKNDAFLQIEKNRAGDLGDLRLLFNGKESKFTDYVENQQYYTIDQLPYKADF